jgi:hypothetical protein
VFGIAIGGAFKEIQGSLSHLPAEPAAGAGPAEGEPPAAGEQGISDELAARRARRRAG